MTDVRKVAIILGSKSDLPKMEKATEMLRQLGVSFSVDIISAHRTPQPLKCFAELIDESEDVQVVIAGAGMSAALPGCIAALTTKPVIGVPLSGSSLNDLAALLSMTQMPPGIPVLTVGVDACKNAALAAASIISLNDTSCKENLENFRKEQTSEGLKNHKIDGYASLYDRKP